jgi:hypothetical protein
MILNLIKFVPRYTMLNVGEINNYKRVVGDFELKCSLNSGE